MYNIIRCVTVWYALLFDYYPQFSCKSTSALCLFRQKKCKMIIKIGPHSDISNEQSHKVFLCNYLKLLSLCNKLWAAEKQHLHADIKLLFTKLRTGSNNATFLFVKVKYITTSDHGGYILASVRLFVCKQDYIKRFHFQAIFTKPYTLWTICTKRSP